MRKNCFRTLAATLAIGSLMHIPAWAESAVITGSEVNLRAGPGTNYRIVDCLDWGTRVNVTDRSNGAWYAIEVDGETGFMSSAYLAFEEEDMPDWARGDGDTGSAPQTPQQPQTETPQQTQPQQTQTQPQAVTAAEGEAGIVNAMYVRFRSGPGSDYSILGEYNRGKALTVVGTSGSWACCVIDGTMGYVYEAYVTVGGTAETPAAQTPSATPKPTAAPAVVGDPYGSDSDWNVDDQAPAWARGDGTTPTPSPSVSAAPAVSANPAPSAMPVSQAASSLGQGQITGNYVRFRTGPGTNFQIIDSYDYGQALTVTGTYGDWTACLIDGVFGYVHSNYVLITSYSAQTQAPQPGSVTPVSTPTPMPAPTPTPTPVVAVEEKTGYVSGNNVRMRAGASMSAKILGELYYGNQVTIKGVSGDWTAVTCNGQEGYIYSQYVKEGSLTIAGNTVTGGSYTNQGGTAGSSTASSPAQSDGLSGSSYEKGQQIAQFALQYVGYNYSWGGKDPSTGFDCSGLVYYTYQHFGYNINRVAQDQARNGVPVSADELQPGDILCFYSGSSYIGHAGIYIGSGMFVHAQNSATGVVITELAGHYADRGYEARRIV